MTHVTFDQMPSLVAALVEQVSMLNKKVEELTAQTTTAKWKGERLVGMRAICKGLKITNTTVQQLIINGAPIYQDDKARYFCYTHEMDDYYKKNIQI